MDTSAAHSLDLPPCGVDVEETCQLALPFFEKVVDLLLIRDWEDVVGPSFWRWLAEAPLSKKVKALFPDYFDKPESDFEWWDVVGNWFWSLVIDLANAVEAKDFTMIRNWLAIGGAFSEVYYPAKGRHEVARVHEAIVSLFENIRAWAEPCAS